jgi:hypothetical protein
VTGVLVTISPGEGVQPPEVCDGQSLLTTVRHGRALSDEPVVSTTLKDERVTQPPIPRRLAGGDLIVSARTREWACIEDTDTGLPESYYRLTGLKQREDRLNPNESVS